MSLRLHATGDRDQKDRGVGEGFLAGFQFNAALEQFLNVRRKTHGILT